MNSKGCWARQFKKALVAKDWKEAEEVFRQVWELYNSLQTPDGKLAISSKRKTGFLGFLACITTVRHLLKKMEDKVLELNYLATYKMSQDHLEIFFNAVRYNFAFCSYYFDKVMTNNSRLRNGWSYNPTSRQFRLAFRKLLVHAGKHVLGSASANCVAQVALNLFC